MLVVVDRMQELGVDLDELLFQIPYEPVAVAGAEEVCQEKGRHEGALDPENAESAQEVRFLQVHKYHQVEPFVVCLFEQPVDPSLVVLHKPETLQMSTHSTHHPRHSCDSLHVGQVADPLLLVHLLRFIPHGPVETSLYAFRPGQGYSI